jgi:hypothetical protein
VTPEGTPIRGEAVSVAFFSRSAKTHFLKNFGRQFKSSLAQGHAEKAMDSVFRRNITVSGSMGSGLFFMCDQFEAHPVRIGESEHGSSEPFRKALGGYASIQEP